MKRTWLTLARVVPDMEVSLYTGYLLCVGSSVQFIGFIPYVLRCTVTFSLSLISPLRTNISIFSVNRVKVLSITGCRIIKTLHKIFINFDS